MTSPPSDELRAAIQRKREEGYPAHVREQINRVRAQLARLASGDATREELLVEALQEIRGEETE